jgi:hypothetical protein
MGGLYSATELVKKKGGWERLLQFTENKRKEILCALIMLCGKTYSFIPERMTIITRLSDLKNDTL